MGVIYLVRHGQADPRAYGVVDATVASATGEVGGLTETGVVQAALTGALLAGQTPTFTAAISGDLPRQRDTLTGVLGRFDNPPEPAVDARWNEYALPALVGAASAEQFADGRGYQQHLDASLAHWIDQTTDPDSVLDDGETYAAFRARVQAAGRAAAELAGSGQTVLVVTSAGVISQWIADLWGVPPLKWPAVSRAMVNASVTKLIVGRRGVSVVSFNEHAHLDDRDGGVATFR